MKCYTVQLRDNITHLPIVGQMISADSGSIQRRALAERLCKKHSDPSRCYVVEFEKQHDSPCEEGTLIKQYKLASEANPV